MSFRDEHKHIHVELEIFNEEVMVMITTSKGGIAKRISTEFTLEGLPTREDSFIGNIISMSKDLIDYGDNKNDRGEE